MKGLELDRGEVRPWNQTHILVTKGHDPFGQRQFQLTNLNLQ